MFLLLLDARKTRQTMTLQSSKSFLEYEQQTIKSVMIITVTITAIKLHVQLVFAFVL